METPAERPTARRRPPPLPTRPPTRKVPRPPREAGGERPPVGVASDPRQEQAEERLERVIEERVGRLVEERLERAIAERLGALDARLERLGFSASADEPGPLERVGEALSRIEARVEALEASEQRRSNAERSGPSLDERVDGALQAALERLDLQALAERVAIVATGPLMQAIDGRLEELERGRPR